MNEPHRRGRSRRFRETLPSEYPVLIALSAAGVVLGIAREALLILFFGFSETTDTIHLYLLITYSLGLLTDPVRLAGLNLFQTLERRDVAVAAALIIVPFGIAVALATVLLVERDLRIPLLIGITTTGILMQLNHLTMAHKQRGGAVVPTQVVTVLPNVILVPGIIAVGLAGLVDPVAWVLACFFVVPVLQYVLLARIEAPQPEIHGRPPSLTGRLRLMGKHSVTAVGRQGFEIVTRTAMISLGEGFLTAFSLATRVYVSLKFVLIDTFIGARIRRWSTTATRVRVPRAFRVALHPLSIVGLTAAGFVVALGFATPGTRWAFMLVYALFLGLGFPYDAGARILYFESNARMVPERLIVWIAVLEVLFAALAFAITRVSLAHVALALLAWYVVKSALQCGMIARVVVAGPAPGGKAGVREPRPQGVRGADESAGEA